MVLAGLMVSVGRGGELAEPPAVLLSYRRQSTIKILGCDGELWGCCSVQIRQIKSVDERRQLEELRAAAGTAPDVRGPCDLW